MDDQRIESPRDVLLASLAKFYADPVHLGALTDVLKNRAGISLRVLDWLVTNYCKKENIVYVCGGQCFNMWANYKAQLRGFSKSLFDPFKRRNKKRKHDSEGDTDADTDAETEGQQEQQQQQTAEDQQETIKWVDSDGATFRTTVGQLNFFKWAIENGVLRYCIENAENIEKDMHTSTQHRYAPVSGTKKGRRSELSKFSVIKTCSRTKINVKLRFDCR